MVPSVIAQDHLVAEFAQHAHVLFDRDAVRRQHIAGNGRIGAGKEALSAFIRKQPSSARQPDVCIGNQHPENRQNPAHFIIAHDFIFLERRARDGVQQIDRNRADAHFAQVDDHIDAVLHRLAQTDDAAAADSQTCLLRSADGGDFVVVSMGRADIEHVTAKNRCKPVFLKGDNKNVEKTYGFSVSFF